MHHWLINVKSQKFKESVFVSLNDKKIDASDKSRPKDRLSIHVRHLKIDYRLMPKKPDASISDI